MNSSSAHGYASAAYAAALAGDSPIYTLERCGGYLLERRIGDSSLIDATNVYPMLACRDWQHLAGDLDAAQLRWVTVSVVPDPTAGVAPQLLAKAFDFVRPFKRHYLIDVPTMSPSRHHASEARRALRRLHCIRSDSGTDLASEWFRLYEGLIRHRRVSGPAAFDSHCLHRQLSLAGMQAFAAITDGAVCGMALWLVDAHVAYYHLAAVDAIGYRQGASYALMATALECWRDAGVEIAHLGGTAGFSDRDDGLAYFKRGWSNRSVEALFCGRVQDRLRYDELVGQEPSRDYFPAYRAPFPR